MSRNATQTSKKPSRIFHRLEPKWLRLLQLEFGSTPSKGPLHPAGGLASSSGIAEEVRVAACLLELSLCTQEVIGPLLVSCSWGGSDVAVNLSLATCSHYFLLPICCSRRCRFTWVQLISCIFCWRVPSPASCTFLFLPTVNWHLLLYRKRRQDYKINFVWWLKCVM